MEEEFFNGRLHRERGLLRFRISDFNVDFLARKEGYLIDGCIGNKRSENNSTRGTCGRDASSREDLVSQLTHLAIYLSIVLSFLNVCPSSCSS